MTYAASSSYSTAYQTVVPVDAYQEVVADLQETQELVRSLETQNRELWQQNQQLQQEISRFLGNVNQFKRGADGSVNVPAQRVTSDKAVKQQLSMQVGNESYAYSHHTQVSAEEEGEDLNIWNIIITLICIIAVGASVGYSAFRPSK
jgi:predicted RNase H-like nuclease (RuvC/YqgF family)